MAPLLFGIWQFLAFEPDLPSWIQEIDVPVFSDLRDPVHRDSVFVEILHRVGAEGMGQ